MKRLVTLWALTCVLTFSFAGSAAAHSFSARVLSDVHVGKSKPELKAQMAYSNNVLEHFKSKQHHWRLLPRHATCWSHVQSKALRHVCNASRKRFAAHRWLYRIADARYTALYAPKVAPVAAGEMAWFNDGATQCEISHEGTWTSVSPDGTYAGHFQMDYNFETSTSYGKQMETQYGRSNNWPPSAQIHHAYERWLVSGWGPWPPYYVYGCASYAGRSYS